MWGGGRVRTNTGECKNTRNENSRHRFLMWFRYTPTCAHVPSKRPKAREISDLRYQVYEENPDGVALRATASPIYSPHTRRNENKNKAAPDEEYKNKRSVVRRKPIMCDTVPRRQPWPHMALRQKRPPSEFLTSTPSSAIGASPSPLWSSSARQRSNCPKENKGNRAQEGRWGRTLTSEMRRT